MKKGGYKPSLDPVNPTPPGARSPRGPFDHAKDHPCEYYSPSTEVIRLEQKIKEAIYSLKKIEDYMMKCPRKASREAVRDVLRFLSS